MVRSAAFALMSVCLLACGNETGISAEPPVFVEGNAQPVAETVQTDVVLQVASPVVDALWVIDNSCSMEDEQANLVANFPDFMSYFLTSGLDYHIGVVSTDLDDSDHEGRLIAVDDTRYITPDTESPVEVFTTMATVGTDGSGLEKGRLAVFAAIEGRATDPENIGFYRFDAALHTVIITDEDDDTDEGVLSKDEFVAWYSALKARQSRRTFSSIVSPEGGGAYDGADYLELTDEIGGIPWNINSPNWSVVLDRLGVQASGLRKEFFLTQLPVPASIEVEVTEEVEGQVVTNVYFPAEFDGDGNLTAGHWVYDERRNSVRFVEIIPEPLATITIRYTLLSTIR